MLFLTLFLLRAAAAPTSPRRLHKPLRSAFSPVGSANDLCLSAAAQLYVNRGELDQSRGAVALDHSVKARLQTKQQVRVGGQLENRTQLELGACQISSYTRPPKRVPSARGGVLQQSGNS